MANYTLHFDGSCGPKNPGGTAAYGFALFESGYEKPLQTGSGVIGEGAGMTNNLAEFHALWRGLLAFHNHRDPTVRHTLQVYGDSKLVIEVMNKHWKPKMVKAYFGDYAIADHTTVELRKGGVTVMFDWVPRESNQVCDDLSKAHQKPPEK